MKCSYAFPGTFGHECGRPATWIASQPSSVKPGTVYRSGRCDSCKEATGPDNRGIFKFEKYDAGDATREVA